ncbi:MAG: hypothetical protein NVSMB20_04960 [Bradyrhizobium sp.]
MAREALTDARGFGRYGAAVCVIAVAAVLAAVATAAHSPRHGHDPTPHPKPVRVIPYPDRPWPIEISGSQYAPVAWADIAGWNEDDSSAPTRRFA